VSGFPARAGAPAAVVDLEGVRVVYGAHPVVDVASLAVREGELLGVIGPNGSGKSTLLRILGLLEAPTAGVVRFRGQPVVPRDLLAARRQMASVFQDPLLIDATAFDNVALGLRFRGLPRRAVAARVGPWMDRLGIAHLAGRRARTLSGGEAQRTALARALVLQPALLLLDEPFSALDPPTREALMVELGGILRQDRITTVLVTHDRGETLALGDRAAVMLAGRSSTRPAASSGPRPRRPSPASWGWRRSPAAASPPPREAFSRWTSPDRRSRWPRARVRSATRCCSVSAERT
jgi:tungstate transport system ATP-binding protein